ncbi:CoA transferase [Pseudofrankia sp. BMG5.37]|uniref:CoA transferase n=1 Tax=Pseudofrankia sp. BMG5.37 TaxID=3050035 RepID=UPI002895C3E9|nr:CoA transferase [Pseudofrankia sp. BMG5.37]MDT3446339.1 CoA transferase [Pseudofrankia sp. BMG5.37]
MQTLQGLRVLDLATGLAGRLASGLLAEFGAEVVRIESKDGVEVSPQFVFADHRKLVRCVPADERPRVAEEALAGIDICFVDEPNGVPAGAHDGMIVTLTPPYTGDLTPWAGGGESAELLHAYGGFAAFQASYSGRPIDLIYPYVTIVHALWAATCTVAALIERESSGRGQSVEVSGVHAANIFMRFLYAREVGIAEPSRAVGPGGLNPLYTRYRAADGRWVFVGALGPKFIRAALAATGSLHLLDDPRIGGRLEALWSANNREWVINHLTEYFAAKPAADCVDVLEAADVPATILETRESWFSGTQLGRHRDGSRYRSSRSGSGAHARHPYRLAWNTPEHPGRGDPARRPRPAGRA